MGCRWHLGENKSYSVSGEHRSLFEEVDDVSSMPECTTVEQMIQHQALNYELFTLEQKHLRNLTKCLVPCNFKRYQLSGTPVTLSSKILRLGNRSLSVFSTEERENEIDLSEQTLCSWTLCPPRLKSDAKLSCTRELTYWRKLGEHLACFLVCRSCHFGRYWRIFLENLHVHSARHNKNRWHHLRAKDTLK